MTYRSSCSSILIFLFFAACVNSDSSEEKLQSLYRQRIPHSKYVIYDFRYSGSMAWSSDYAGATILDSNLKFSIKRIDELPCDYIDGKLQIENLKMIRIAGPLTPTFPKDTLLTPLKKYSKRCDGVNVNVTEYNETYGSAIGTGLMEYGFENFKETDDSLIFYGVAKIFGYKELPAVAAFCKGNIRVEDSSSGNINYIAIRQMVITRGEIYKPTKPLEIVENQPIIGQAELWFYPKHAMKSSLLTDYGIYKQVK